MIFRPPFTVTTIEFVHNTLLLARQVMIRHRRPRDPRRMDGVDRDDFLTAARPTTEPSSHSLGQEHLHSELSDYGHHSQFAVHHPDLTFESGVYVRPVIYRGSDNVYGDSFYCVYQYLWGLSIGGIAPLPPTFAHTTRFTEYRMWAPLSSWHKLFILWSILLTHSCTDKFSLCDHPELPLYTI